MFLQPDAYQKKLPQCSDGNGYCATEYNFYPSVNGEPLPSFYWIVIPQFLTGFAEILVFLSALEFILAQAPRTMQGLLIGLWYAIQSVNTAIAIPHYTTCVAFRWQYYASKSLLVLLSFILFLLVAHKYKYRQLNEDADINVRREVEDVFERNFDREDAYEQRRQREYGDADVA